MPMDTLSLTRCGRRTIFPNFKDNIIRASTPTQNAIHCQLNKWKQVI